MTYTFKLARRLAMSRDLSMVSALLLLASCAGDSTGPETTTTTNQPASDFAVRLIPRTVTIETNQKIRFRGQILRGRERTTTLAWSATGGTISRHASTNHRCMPRRYQQSTEPVRRAPARRAARASARRA